MYYILERLPTLWWYTLFLITGIITGYHSDSAIIIVITCIATIILCWISEYYAHHAKTGIFFLCCFILGSILIRSQMYFYQTTIKQYENGELACIGTVIDYTTTPHLPLRHKIIIALDSTSLNAGIDWQRCRSYSLVLHTKQSYEYLVGSRIKLEHINLKPTSPSFSLFCMRNNYLGIMHSQVFNYELISQPSHSWIRYICSYKQRMIASFKKQMNAKTFTFFAALFLGYNDCIKKSIKHYQKLFQKWGIIHYLARSGLHLVIVTILFEYLFSFIPWSFTLGRIVILMCGFLYWLLTWPTLSFYRALMLFALTHGARIMRKQHHFLHILLLTCFCFLIINPVTLFFLDFQLTFGITFALAFFNYAALKPFI